MVCLSAGALHAQGESGWGVLGGGGHYLLERFFGFAAACDSHAGTDSLREWYRPLEHQDQDDASGMAAIKKELHAACDLGGTYSYVARRPLTSFQ